MSSNIDAVIYPANLKDISYAQDPCLDTYSPATCYDELESDHETLYDGFDEEDEPVFIPLDVLLPSVKKEFDEISRLILQADNKTPEEKAEARQAMQAIENRISYQEELFIQFPDFTSPKQYDMWEIKKDLEEVQYAMES